MEGDANDQASGHPEESQAQIIEGKLAKLFEKEQAPAPKTKAEAPKPEEVEEETEQSEDAAPQLEEVEYEGEKFQVPPKLKEAIIHKADYTRKTQEVADTRRQLELQAEAFKAQEAESTFAQTIEEPLRNLSILDARTKHLLANWQTLDADQKSELLYLDKQREMITQEIRGKRHAFDQDHQKTLSDLRVKTAEAVRKAIPGWSDTLAKDITDHAVSDGYTQHELANITDPRYIKTLWKAREFDRLQALAKAAPSKAIPVVKSGPSNQMPQHVKDNFAFSKAMKTAKTDTEKARLIEQRFAKKFGK